MQFRARDSAIRESRALKADHIARITSDFKMDLIKSSMDRLSVICEISYEMVSSAHV